MTEENNEKKPFTNKDTKKKLNLTEIVGGTLVSTAVFYPAYSALKSLLDSEKFVDVLKDEKTIYMTLVAACLYGVWYTAKSLVSNLCYNKKVKKINEIYDTFETALTKNKEEKKNE